MSVHKTPNGQWRVRWREGDRNRSQIIGRKRDAEAFDAEVRRRRRLGELAMGDAGKQTLAEFVKEWWTLYAAVHLSTRTQRSYTGLWDRHILPRVGGHRLCDLHPELIERFAADLRAAGVGEPTIYRALALLQGVLQRAVEWRRISRNPVRMVRKPNVRRTRQVRPLTPTTIEQLRIAARQRRRYGHRDATLISVLAYAGLRPEEALALTWGDVRERTLSVDKATDGQGGIKPTKNRHSRSVRLLAPLAADLAEWRLVSGRPPGEPPVFPNRQGGAWNDYAWQTWHRDAWHPAREAAGVSDARPYDLRHSFISLLISEGRNIIDVAREAGHSPTMTLEVYGHVIDEFDPSERVSAEAQVRRARDELVPDTFPRQQDSE